MTYYKYAERNVANQMDWSVVNKEITQTLQEENKLRKEKKAAIDEATRLYGKNLTEQQLGENIGANTWFLEFAGDARPAMLELNRKLKSGDLSLKDWTIQAQNLKDGTDNVTALFNEYQTEYKKNVEAYQKGDMSYESMWQMGQIDGLSNFAETKLYINPMDYSLSVGKKVFNEKTGVYEMSSDPNDFASITSLRNRLKTITPKFDVDGNLKAGADVLGTEIRVLKSRGVLTLADITQRKEYKDAENNFIKSQMVDPNNVGSILTDHDKTNKATGQQWDYTRDPEAAKKDPNLILMIPDPANPASGRLVPKLTSEQEKVAEDFLRNRLRTMLDVKETPTETIRATESDYERGNQRKQEDTSVNMVGLLYYGNDADVATAENYFTGLNPRIQYIDRVGDSVIIKYFDGPESTLKLQAGGSPIGLENWIKGSTELTGVKNINEALKRGSYKKDGVFNPAARGRFERKLPTSGTKGFSEKTLKWDAQKNPIKLADDFNNKVDDIDYKWTRDSTIAKDMTSVVTSALNTLPSALTNGMVIKSVLGGANAGVAITMPTLTDTVIRIPIGGSEENMRNNVKNITKYLYDLAALGGEYNQAEVDAIIGGQSQQGGTTSGAEGDELFN